ncbi:MAG: flagellar basal body P-ring formation protein FlgA [Armatimonadetes bacterium]|nr:flagellar basal body P-ring formation protein FlgA [Armatimonadota bacterium]
MAASAILQNGPWRKGEVELVPTGAIPSLSIPPGKVEMIPGPASFRPGYAAVSVHVKVDGKEVRTVPVSFQVMIYQWVLVTRGTVPPDTRMEDVPLERARRTVTGRVEQYPSQQRDLAGMVSRSYIPGGRILTYDLVQSPFDVRRGTLVALVARAGAVEVSLTGKAMRDGRRGDRIPVYNMEARKEVEGIVTGPGTVEIKVR